MRLIFFLAFLVFVTSFSCTWNNEAELYPCDSINVTYSQTVKAIIEKRCYSCHSASNSALYGDGINLEGYSNLKNATDAGLVLGNIKHEPGFLAMPKGGPKLSDCDIAKIEAWVNKGAPED